jgi:putative ABC transport system permease protein
MQKVGDMIQLTVEGRPATFRLVGIIRQVLTPAAAYITPQGYAIATGQSLQSITAVRVVMNQRDAATVNRISGQIENALTAEDVSLRILFSQRVGRRVSGHVYIFIA